jgi:hypothetical protein
MQQRYVRRLRGSQLFLLACATILTLALGRLVYHYMLFQSTILTLMEF